MVKSAHVYETERSNVLSVLASGQRPPGQASRPMAMGCGINPDDRGGENWKATGCPSPKPSPTCWKFFRH